LALEAQNLSEKSGKILLFEKKMDLRSQDVPTYQDTRLSGYQVVRQPDSLIG